MIANWLVSKKKSSKNDLMVFLLLFSSYNFYSDTQVSQIFSELLSANNKLNATHNSILLKHSGEKDSLNLEIKGKYYI